MTAISAAISTGSSKSRHYSVTAGILMGSSSQMFSFNVPIVSSVSLQSNKRNKGIMDNNKALSLLGENFGRIAYCLGVRVGRQRHPFLGLLHRRRLKDLSLSALLSGKHRQQLVLCFPLILLSFGQMHKRQMQ